MYNNYMVLHNKQDCVCMCVSMGTSNTCVFFAV